MGTKRIHTDLDMQGNALYGIATAPPGTNTQQAASTAYVVAALQGNAKVIDVIGLQSSGFLTGLLGAEAVVSGSDFTWSKDFLPPGRQVYLETFASGSALTTQATVSFVSLAGVVAASTMTTNTTTGGLVRSAAFVPVDGTTYQIRFKAAVLGTGSLKLARLILL
jgi:hypothetical protein